jgi:hypothetical protein
MISIQDFLREPATGKRHVRFHPHVWVETLDASVNTKCISEKTIVEDALMHPAWTPVASNTVKEKPFSITQ